GGQGDRGHGSGVPPAEKIGELFGFERLHHSAAYWAQHAESAEVVAQGIWSDLTSWCGEESHHDDMTLLVLRVP
ncbi:MAG TPA: SpoIIE family protein phosphatase, partial [Chloroflexota bacterium]|nr:SpoIIE family protein phosphatase [Chloroflexota bacterium]